jgi:hypothetical protein
VVQSQHQVISKFIPLQVMVVLSLLLLVVVHLLNQVLSIILLSLVVVEGAHKNKLVEEELVVLENQKHPQVLLIQLHLTQLHL